MEAGLGIVTHFCRVLAVVTGAKQNLFVSLKFGFLLCQRNIKVPALSPSQRGHSIPCCKVGDVLAKHFAHLGTQPLLGADRKGALV